MLSRLSQEHIFPLLLLLIVFASAVDILADISEGVELRHLLQEGAVMLAAISAFFWLIWSLRKVRSTAQELKAEIDSIKYVEQPKAVIDAKRQLSKVISEQFEAWSLTDSEKEVGLLVLKGFSLKEIAALRQTAEKTIRQQASAIYKKSGLAGRHAFSAWFLEDLL